MLEISEALAAEPIANGEEVIDRLIAEESRNWSIKVSAVEDAHHVYNEIVDVDQHILIGNRKIIHTIGVFALEVESSLRCHSGPVLLPTDAVD